MTIDIPESPTLLGLPHDGWWENQHNTLTKLANSDAKVLLLTAPCLEGSTKVLMDNLSWKRIKDIEVGDGVFGVDEYPRGGKGRGRCFKRTKVTLVTKHIADETFEIVTDKGMVVATPEHPWLSRHGCGALQWKQTQSLKPGYRIKFVFADEQPTDLHAAGYLAGALDGEGHIQRNLSRTDPRRATDHASAVIFTQTKPEVIRSYASAVSRLGFDYHMRVETHENPKWNNKVNTAVAGGTSERIRFMAMVRPSQLLERFIDTIDGVEAKCFGEALVLDVRPAGRKVVYNLQTELATFIANGFVSHNTGSGKSLMGMSLALAWESRKAVILCRSKLLQQQYLDSFPGITQILSGKGNYPCVLPGVAAGTTVDKAPCNAGYQCIHRFGGCSFHDQVQRASMAQVVIANYPVWLLAANLETEMKARFGKLDTLICDEGHALVFGDEMDSLSSIELWPKVLQKHGFGPLLFYADPGYYRAMAGKWLPLAQVMLESRKHEWEKEIVTGSLPPARVAELQELRFLSFAFERLFLIENPADWIVDGPMKAGEMPPDGSVVDKWRVKLVPILGGDRKKLIYKHSRRVVIMSATLLPTPQTAKFLGLDGDYMQMEIPSTFPIENRPIYYWPVGRITRETTESMLPSLVARMDDIIEGNLPERGLIHATSFTLAQAVIERSRFKKFMRTHETKNRLKVAQEWLAGKGKPILVSPSLHEGLDAKGNACRWQIILKVPFPNLGEPVWKARMRLDKSLYMYAAASGIVQMAGRAVRTPEDHATSYLLDGCYESLYASYAGFFPKWFSDAVIWM